jgi:hypothetical protein
MKRQIFTHLRNLNTILRFRRKNILFILLTAVIGLFLWQSTSTIFQAKAAENAIITENSNPGTTSWELSKKSNDTSKQIKGFASAASVNKGESITFYITVNPVQTYSIDVYRMGWYNGSGGRLMQHVDAQNGVVQPACPMDTQTGLLQCTNWSPGFTFIIPETWTSGIYLVKLKNAQGYDDHITFTVRDDARTADFLFQQSVSTYQAYNPYPSDGKTGKSLYPYQSSGGNTVGGNTAAVKVSFDRPYSSAARSGGAGELLMWEINMLRWLEKEGYNISYTTDIDTHVHGERLLTYKAFLSVGHDEYYSKEMYDALESARNSGVHLAFFGANDVYWQVRFESSNTGVPNRVMVGYKDAATDPETNNALKTVQFRQSPVNRPEQLLMGAQYTSQLPSSAGAAYVVQNSNHWVWSNTGFSDNSTVPGLVGYETDRIVNTTSLPQNLSFAILAKSPFTNKNNKSDYQNSVIYQAPSGAWVFDAGTHYWSWGLDNYKRNLMNAGIQQATRNILNKFLESTGSPTPTISLPTNTPVPSTTLVPTVSPEVTSTPSPTPTLPPVNSFYNSLILSDGPLSYWRLGELSETKAFDEIGVLPGTYTTGSILGQTGAIANDSNTAAKFNGTSQFVTIPYRVTMNTAPFTIEAWVYPTGGTGTYRGVASSRYFPKGWVLYAGSTDKWSMWVNNGTNMLAVNGAAVALNTWSHIVATFDGRTVRLYVNGIQSGTGTTSSTYQPNPSRPFTIGRGETSFYFPGTIDEVSYFNKVLSASQVQAHFSAGK